MDKLAVVTVNFENYQVTEEFLESFKKNKNSSYKIFISDLSREKKVIKSNLDIEVIEGSNNGYAYGVNLGLKKAIDEGFTKFVVINNDTQVSEEFISRVLNSLNKNPTSIIGGKIYYSPGFEYHKSRYKSEDLGKVIWYAGGVMDWNNVGTSHQGVDEVDHGQYDQRGETEFITGCLIGFDKMVIDRISFWDESYFLYFEDADWCERAKKAGIKLFYDPSIIIWHKNAQSTGGSGSKLHQNYQKKNQLKFGLKYAPFRTKLHLLFNIALHP